jgi:hypothetical protein
MSAYPIDDFMPPVERETRLVGVTRSGPRFYNPVSVCKGILSKTSEFGFLGSSRVPFCTDNCEWCRSHWGAVFGFNESARSCPCLDAEFGGVTCEDAAIGIKAYDKQHKFSKAFREYVGILLETLEV